MGKQDETVGIIFLRSTGYQRLNATGVELRFDPAGGVTFIEGKNAQGKTSVLDSLEFAIVGKSALSEQPIHTGLDEATVEIGLTNGRRIVRHVKRKGEKQYTTALELFGSNGEKFEPREATVRDWLGDPGIAFDPMDFARMDSKKRRKLLAQIVGIDLDQFDTDEKAAESARLAHYGSYETAKRKNDALGPVLKKPETVDVSALNEALNKALEDNRAVDDARRGAADRVKLAREVLSASRSSLSVLEADIADMETALAAKRKSVTEWQASIPKNEASLEAAETAQAAANAMPQVEIAAIQDNLASASEVNKAAAEYEFAARQRNEIMTDWRVQDEKRTALTEAVEAVRKARLKALQTAVFPVAGLGFEADDCTFNGIPFAQASQSEQIRVGLAIAMAQNPTLKLITSYDGSLLDEDNIKIVHEETKGKGYTLVLEMVTNKPTGRGLFIEDGAQVETDNG